MYGTIGFGLFSKDAAYPELNISFVEQVELG